MTSSSGRLAIVPARGGSKGVADKNLRLLAGRTLLDYAAGAARESQVVDRIVRQRMDQGQLREAPITLAQLETVKEQFTRVLAGMYHSRIDYPAASGGITAEFGEPPAQQPAPEPKTQPASTSR